MTIALVFPGQGSQSLGMLKTLSETFPAVTSIFNRASAVLGYDLWALVQEGPVERLDQTEYTQPAMLAADMAVYAYWQSQAKESPAYFAGHSLGEYAALVAAESLSFEDAISLVAKRGAFMQEAPAGAMAAIVGLEDAAVVDICASIAGVVSPANFNSVGQVVIAGEVPAVEAAIEGAKQKGAKIAKKIPVSVASHCMLMASAAQKMAAALMNVAIQSPKTPIVHNVDVKLHATPDAIREALVQQLISPVRWVETMQWLQNQGVNHFFECGPGKVLTGLNKRISSALLPVTLPNL